MERLRNEDGQGALELALALPFLLLLVCGTVDFGYIYSDRVGVANAARDGARYASLHPTAWSTASTAPINTIEGQIQNSGGTDGIANDDTHIAISYLNPDGTACGSYSVTNGFQGSESTCVTPGNLIQVRVTYQYTVFTPVMHLLFSSVSISSTATMVEEQ